MFRRRRQIVRSKFWVADIIFYTIGVQCVVLFFSSANFILSGIHGGHIPYGACGAIVTIPILIFLWKRERDRVSPK